METATDTPEFDIRACPIWAIPQIARYHQIIGLTVIEFELLNLFVGTPQSSGWLRVRIESKGRYEILVKKSEMNDVKIRQMEWMGD